MEVEAKEFDEASSNGVVKEGVPKFLEMQECYNICMAAYKEIMTLALKANTWVVDIPVLGSIEKLHHMFREPPSPGMEIEYSIESSVVPLRLDNVVTTMTNVDEWASFFCDIVHNRTAEVSSGVMSNLAPNTPPHSRDNFKCVKTWPCLEENQEMAEPEEVIKLVTDDDSNCITIHAKRVMQTESAEPAKQTETAERVMQTEPAERVMKTEAAERVMQTESTENFEYVLQEDSSDEFCSFIISSQINQSEVNSALGFRKECCSLRPFGFSITPDGSGGLLSDASIVTVACQQELDADLETGEVIERMSNLVSGVFEAINGAFTVGGKKQ